MYQKQDSKSLCLVTFFFLSVWCLVLPGVTLIYGVVYVVCVHNVLHLHVYIYIYTHIYIYWSANFFLIEVVTECWVDLPWYTCVLVNYVFYKNCFYLLIPTSLFIPSLYLSPCITIILLCSFVSLFLFGPLASWY